MSAGDVVCTGWLIKSPPEKKLKRFAWRKRWFVLRRGRMSGNPDVLEYYQSKNSKKPIRVIDLKECEVEMLNGQLRIQRDFHGKHLFVVKTSFRAFYLVAKTEEEMNGWISSISQICHFGSTEDAESSEEGFPNTPTSRQPSPDSSDRVSVSSQLDSSQPPDYLFLSNCETGSVSTSRLDSFSNSEISLEQRSSEDAARDMVPSPLYTDSSASSVSYPSPCPSVFAHGRLANPPFSAPCSCMALPSSSSSPLLHCATSVFQFDKPYSSTSFDATSEGQTPPPLPPKPSHSSEQQSDVGAHRPRPMSARQFSSHASLFPRRTSMSCLDHFRIGDADSRLVRNRRQSLNLPSLNTVRIQSYEDESYVPMASPSPSGATIESDGYIPMSPGTFSFLNTNCKAEPSVALSPLACQPGDFAPPPIHRHLKPRLRRARPPPLDLRGLSTITECPTHLPLSRAMTESCFSAKCLPPERRLENRDNSRDEDTNSTGLDSMQQFCHTFDGAVQTWARKSNLDYLSLDFNSASPSPVQKQKPFLSDDHRVDYVQVDEKKTQALQNTKMEWKDVRQSKT
ncbi:GRB2-associated-binding protein 3 isoform X1 [Acanthopagrus latus]|uniref:GRB2-associated-binding protein 3 isoform X1 n=1 Tax=Acanthopagrus latus TaxID=8177 RepID=UPI00187BD8E5|nr:GRB2-associated-binding protein 3 isoform X1 [Acanthopagrus latus]